MSEAAPATSPAEARAQKSRTFLIGIMMTFLISLSTFAIGTYYFVIPRLYDHEKRLNDVREWAKKHQAGHNEAAAAVIAEQTAAPAGEPAADPAAAPAAPAAPSAPAAPGSP
jgi:hypothetical protein